MGFLVSPFSISFHFAVNLEVAGKAFLLLPLELAVGVPCSETAAQSDARVSEACYSFSYSEHPWNIKYGIGPEIIRIKNTSLLCQIKRDCRRFSSCVFFSEPSIRFGCARIKLQVRVMQYYLKHLYDHRGLSHWDFITFRKLLTGAIKSLKT